jgi:hypothetical protein
MNTSPANLTGIQSGGVNFGVGIDIVVICDYQSMKLFHIVYKR